MANVYSGGFYVFAKYHMVEGTCRIQIQPIGDLLPKEIFTGC